MEIVRYSPEYWEGMQEVHDPARMQELTLAGLEAAFLPLHIAAEREDLFDYHVYIAKEQGKVLGFVAFSDEELAWLYVRPDHQRQGIGRKLAEHALAHMTAEEKSVEVLHGNEPARGLYHSLGFTKETILHGRMPGNESFKVRVWQMTMEK